MWSVSWWSLLLLLRLLVGRRFVEAFRLDRPSSRQRPRDTWSHRPRATASSEVPSRRRRDVRILVIDHYDSFTYNLVDILAEFTGQPPVVIAWDALPPSPNETLGGFAMQDYDGIVLSPGPGAPEDYPATLRLLRRLVAHAMAAAADDASPTSIPVLGVCLGHQMLAQVYNATVVPAPEPIHGQVWDCRVLPLPEDQATTEHHVPHDPETRRPPGSRLFRQVPASFRATRYHSLQVILPRNDSGGGPSYVRPTAVTLGPEPPVLMALESTIGPHYGVQFHPESIGSLDSVGRTLLHNFLDVCEETAAGRTRSTEGASGLILGRDDRVAEGAPGWDEGATEPPQRPTVLVHRLDPTPLSPEQVMLRLYHNDSHAFWLDAATAPVGQATQLGDSDKDPGVSILGASRRRVEYWSGGPQGSHGNESRVILEYDEDESVRRTDQMDILEYLSRHHAADRRTDAVTMVEWSEEDSVAVMNRIPEGEVELPFDYRGGHVGYLGYEVRFDTLRSLQRAEGAATDRSESTTTTEWAKMDPGVPTAAFMYAERSCVYHHASDTWYLVALARRDEDVPASVQWMRSTAAILYMDQGSRDENVTILVQPKQKPSFVPNRSREKYQQDFLKCQECIRMGESYELCLTNQLETTIETETTRSPLDLYRILRRSNPAPHAAFFQWNFDQSSARCLGSLAICCSSPERFISVWRSKPDGSFVVETKPIKGTRARVLATDRTSLTEDEILEDERRADDLRSSVKDRAENLMIVDLLRNDLSRVCRTGTVHVPKMMNIESYATVHQMVSTIRGQLDASSNAVDVLSASFPGGSMTGAPKIRTMELLHDMEEQVGRGPYSGSLGYISVNGCADMNIVIRSAVLTRPSLSQTKISIGSGGAITHLSNCSDEYDEMILKASAVVDAVKVWLGGNARET